MAMTGRGAAQAGTLRIGGASGFWGEAQHAAAQLLAGGAPDFLIFDYLAEITLSIMARARAKDPGAGWAGDFLSAAMAPNLGAIAAQGVRVISNAGGLNPTACADALRAEIARQGLSLRVATVEGDDLSARAAEFAGRAGLDGGTFPDPARVASVNAYLGAFPIAAALAAGADIVITGRCADSALALGPCIDAFGWGAADLDLLAAGSLVGHLIECGPQATGGNFTDWREAGDFARIGYPVAEVRPDGTCTLVKPEGTAGALLRAAVAEQLVYEIGDPQSYLLPDVIADFSAVTLTEGPDGVRAAGARGRAPSGRLKVAATYADGFRAGQVFGFNGRDAAAKARAFAEAALRRARAALARDGAEDFAEVAAEVIGGTGPQGEAQVVLTLAARHAEARGIAVLIREATGLGLSAPPGLVMFGAGGRPRPSPVVRLFSFLIDAAEAPARVRLEREDIGHRAPPSPAASAPPAAPPPPQAPPAEGPMTLRPLEALAWARSGDKGDAANIGVIARRPEYLPWIWAALTPAAVAARFDGKVRGGVERFPWPGIDGMNLLMHGALGGGGMASLRWDAQGKGFAQTLLGLAVPVPAALAPPADAMALAPPADVTALAPPATVVPEGEA